MSDIDRIKNLTHCLRLMIGGIVLDRVEHDPVREEDLGALQELSFLLSTAVNAYYAEANAEQLKEDALASERARNGQR